MSANEVRSWMVAAGCAPNWMAALDGLKVTDVEDLLLNWEDNKASIESNVIRQRALQNRLKELVESISATTRNAAVSNISVTGDNRCSSTPPIYLDPPFYYTRRQRRPNILLETGEKHEFHSIQPCFSYHVFLSGTRPCFFTMFFEKHEKQPV